MSAQKREKDKTLHLCPLTGTKQIELSVPIGFVDAAGVVGATGGCIDHGIHALKGVIEAVGLQQVTPGQLTTPFLQKGSLAGGPHHAAHLVAGVKGTTGDLSSQGAGATHHKHLHRRLPHEGWSLMAPVPKRLLQSSPCSFRSRAPPARPTGIKTQKIAAVPKISAAMVWAKRSPAHLNPFPPQAGADL